MNWLTHPIIMLSLGGALGSNARYWLGRAIRDWTFNSPFPWGTLAINISGSILLGIIAACVKDRTSAVYLLLGTGFCGGYTTFSTFSLELIEALQRGQWNIAVIYMVSSVVGGLVGLAIIALLTLPATPTNG